MASMPGLVTLWPSHCLINRSMSLSHSRQLSTLMIRPFSSANAPRVLVPEGRLIVSTPNRPVYSGDGRRNPFHQLEFDENEFVNLLRVRFRSIQLYTQFPQSAAWWSPRSMAAERSPWLRVKGFWRLSSWFCPAIRAHVDPVVRSTPADAVLAHDNFSSSLFNPYIVRARASWTRERPYILVAVAEGIFSH